MTPDDPLAALRRGEPGQPLFLFDVGAPAAWPVAERILRELPVLAEWVPVALGPDPRPDWADVERRAAAAGALPFVAPAAWPPDTAQAMAALTYSRMLGKTVAFALALFRHAYAAGRALDAEETVLLAGAAAEVHPRALLAAVGQRGTTRAVAEARAAAHALGVTAGPAIVLADGRALTGPDCLQEAACSLATPTG
jgi:2-hydroxychromene-2-carboxylate isomerase